MPRRLTEADATSKLSQFLAQNPSSKIGRDAESGRIRITSSWGDASLALDLPDTKTKEFYDVLNAVALPERYSAIIHKDTNDIEFIFTALPLGGIDDIRNRRFSLRHRGATIDCEYGPSSARLLTIARHSQFLEQSATQFRNLQSFYYSQQEYTQADLARMGIGFEPVCFWIRSIILSEDDLFSLINEVNFMMTYYDRRSPVVTVHSPKLENVANQPLPRFREGRFPSVIATRSMDENLLRYWHVSLAGDPASRFIYSYRIVEYASGLYLDPSVKSNVRRVLADPKALDDISSLTETIIGHLQFTKQDETSRFEALVREVVTPDSIWVELSRNINAFNQATTFEGGFILDAIAQDAKNAKQFGSNGITAFAKRVATYGMLFPMDATSAQRCRFCRQVTIWSDCSRGLQS